MEGGWCWCLAWSPPSSTDLVEYINIPTTSKLNNLSEGFSLLAYLNMKRLHMKMIADITYLTNNLTVLLCPGTCSAAP